VETSDLRLDGNALAGDLHELFGVEMTVANGVCDNCGASGEVGELVVYAHAPGLVARCPHCEAVMIRIVRGRGRIWLDLRGVRTLSFASS
jgi:Zn finger protein HypA/HybF involved in hydrogenase expression